MPSPQWFRYQTGLGGPQLTFVLAVETYVGSKDERTPAETLASNQRVNRKREAAKWEVWAEQAEAEAAELRVFPLPSPRSSAL